MPNEPLPSSQDPLHDEPLTGVEGVPFPPLQGEPLPSTPGTSLPEQSGNVSDVPVITAFVDPDEADDAGAGSLAVTGYVPQVGRFYRVDSSRNTFTEIWRDTRSPLVLIGWLSKLLRIKLPGSVNDPNVVSLRPFLVPDEAVAETVPCDVRHQFEPVLRELTDLGFGTPVYFEINDVFHHSRTFQAALLHRDERTVARVSHRVEGVQARKTHFFTEFLSVLASGRFFLSSSARAQLLTPPVCRLNWHYGATASQLWASHRQKLDAIALCGDPVVRMGKREEMLDALERYHEAVRDFHVQRGVFSSMQGEDLARAEALDKNLERARSGQLRYPEVMAQLERLQQRQTSWMSAILMLVVSIGLFVGAGAGAWKWSWEMLLIIVGVLFVHEGGHYLAMRVFRYRNVRMFFIPFFGAAVSGQHYSAPGWKKVVVALMGPLPGIFLGGGLGIAGLIKGDAMLTKVAMMAIILNGFNLLPVLPLDGGRVMHALLFCRHRYLDTIFNVLAAAALIGLGILTGDKVLLYLGIFMVIGVSAAYKVAEIAGELRRQGFGPQRGAPGMASPGAVRPMPTWSPNGSAGPLAPPVPGMAGAVPFAQPAAAVPAAPSVPTAIARPAAPPAEEHTIPQATAEMIIERVQARFPRIKNPKQIAELTLRAYESLAARPPGILASLGFALLHGVSFLTALVLLAVLIYPPNKWPTQMGADPKYRVDPQATITWYGPSSAEGAVVSRGQRPPTSGALAVRDHDTLVATFSTASEAQEQFNILRKAPAGFESLVLFGQTILASLPSADASARMKWLGELEGRATDVFVDGGGGFRASMTLVCRTPSVRAEAIERELANYFNVPVSICLIPPWAEGDLDRRGEDERARHEVARETYSRLERVSVFGAPEMKALNAEMARAARRNDEAEYRRLSKQQTELREQLRTRKLKRIRDGAVSSTERELADRYIAIEIAERTARKAAVATAPAGREWNEESDEDEEMQGVGWDDTARRRAELGPLMGQLPLPGDGGRPSAQTVQYSCHGFSSLVERNRLTLIVTFEDVARGMPALVNWLDKHGCRDFQYQLSSTGALESDTD